MSAVRVLVVRQVEDTLLVEVNLDGTLVDRNGYMMPFVRLYALEAIGVVNALVGGGCPNCSVEIFVEILIF